jgi:hypothetical protein
MEEQWLVLGLCAQQPLYINHASPEKRPQEGPSKAVPSRKVEIRPRLLSHRDAFDIARRHVRHHVDAFADGDDFSHGIG